MRLIIHRIVCVCVCDIKINRPLVGKREGMHCHTKGSYTLLKYR